MYILLFFNYKHLYYLFIYLLPFLLSTPWKFSRQIFKYFFIFFLKNTLL